jgi:hypothetical protein
MGNGDVLRLDAQTGRQQARLRSGPSGFAHALTVGYGALWVVRDRVARIDPVHRLTLDVPGTASGTAFAIAVGGGSVWVVDDGANEVLRIAPRRAKLIARVDVPGRAWGVAAGRQSVIVISVPTNGSVSGPDGPRLLRRLNPKTNELSRPLARLTCDAGVAVTSRAVWTLDACTGVLARRDPRTLEVRRERRCMSCHKRRFSLLVRCESADVTAVCARRRRMPGSSAGQSPSWRLRGASDSRCRSARRTRPRRRRSRA